MITVSDRLSGSPVFDQYVSEASAYVCRGSFFSRGQVELRGQMIVAVFLQPSTIHAIFKILPTLSNCWRAASGFSPLRRRRSECSVLRDPPASGGYAFAASEFWCLESELFVVGLGCSSLPIRL